MSATEKIPKEKAEKRINTAYEPPTKKQRVDKRNNNRVAVVRQTCTFLQKYDILCAVDDFIHCEGYSAKTKYARDYFDTYYDHRAEAMYSNYKNGMGKKIEKTSLYKF
eukprot:50154-Ditylum_brightwellii.AAC.1